MDCFSEFNKIKNLDAANKFEKSENWDFETTERALNHYFAELAKFACENFDDEKARKITEKLFSGSKF